MLPPPPVLAPPAGTPAGAGGVVGVGLAEPSGVGLEVLGVTAGTGRDGGLDDTGADGPGRGVQVHLGVGVGGGVKQRHVGVGAGGGV
jgi:hypothetical protein